MKTWKTLTPAPAVIPLMMLVSGAAMAQNFGPWDNPQPVVAVNMPASAEGCPIESQDGLSLYIASNRAGGSGKLDIWRSRRASSASSWGLPQNVGATVNTNEFDYCPTPLQGKWLLFVTSKNTEADGDPLNDDCLPGPEGLPPPGSPAPGDIFLSQENPSHGWTRPLHLGCYPNGPNTAGYEFSPSLVNTAQGTVLFFSSNGYPNSQGHDIYASRVLANGTVTAGVRVAELSTPADDRMPNVRKDGLEIVFSSTRQGNMDIYVAKRASTSMPWNTPQRIANPEINTAASETRASLSGDGTRLYFGRKLNLDDPGDVFVSTRRKN